MINGKWNEFCVYGANNDAEVQLICAIVCAMWWYKRVREFSAFTSLYVCVRLEWVRWSTLSRRWCVCVCENSLERGKRHAIFRHFYASTHENTPVGWIYALNRGCWNRIHTLHIWELRSEIQTLNSIPKEFRHLLPGSKVPLPTTCSWSIWMLRFSFICFRHVKQNLLKIVYCSIAKIVFQRECIRAPFKFKSTGVNERGKCFRFQPQFIGS